MSKARQLADLGNQVDDGAITGSNIIVNGGMTVAQRGVSVTPTGTGSTYVALDRWDLYRNSSFSPNITVSQSTDAPSGFLNSMKVDVNAADTPTGGENFGFRTKIEGLNTGIFNRRSPNAENMTLSFYVKSNKTGTYSVQLFDMGGTIYSKLVTYTIVSADTWERKEITVQANPNGSNPTLSNEEGLRIAFDLGSGPDDVVPLFDWSSTYGGATRVATGQVNLLDSTSNYWQITGVCLNIGDSAIAFPHDESYGDTLAKCQRYYYQVEPTGYNFGAYATSALSTQDIWFPVTMRASPSLSNDQSSSSYTSAEFVNFSLANNHAGRLLHRSTSISDNARYNGGMILKADAEL